MSRSTSKKGFTLVEAVISTALLVMVIGGSYKVVGSSQSLIYSARNHYVAINIARARLERVRNFAYDQLFSLGENNIVVNDSGVPSSDGYFRRTTVISTNGQPAGLTRIDVTTEIRNTKTLNFTGEHESLATFATEYLTP